MTSAPLEGIRVLEFSQIIAAPYAGQILADMGADVLKIEPPEGESWRLQAQFVPNESKTYQNLNRGKKCLTLRLSDPRAQEIVRQLVVDMDVVLINYRPDVPRKFGIDYESLQKLKEDLVYVDLTAFGRNGPWALRPGYDGVVQAVSGLMAGEGKSRPTGAPMTISSTAIADFTTGIVLADAVTSALFHRERTGQGQMVQCSLLATALNLQGAEIMEHEQADRRLRNPLREERIKKTKAGASFKDLVGQREDAFATRSDIFYRSYLTSDGAIVLAAKRDDDINQACDLLGVSRDGTSAAEISDRISHQSTSFWVDKLAAAGIPVAPVNFSEEMSHHGQVLANNWMVELEHDLTGPQTQMEPLLDFEGIDLRHLRGSPVLGAHSESVLAKLGYNQDRIKKLQEDGVI